MTTASEPLVVTISHGLGREEAKRRIDNGLGGMRAEMAPYVSTLDYSWEGDRLDFHAAAMLQTISGRIEVFEEYVRIELSLPFLLHLVAKQITGRIESRAAAMLEPPVEKPKA